MTFVDIMGLAKEAVLILFFSLFCITVLRTWRRADCEQLRLIPLKEVADVDHSQA